MMNTRLNNLAKIAFDEASLELAGKQKNTGPDIEKYLSVFRKPMNINGNTDQYSNLNQGYSWCCAFVYYCCLQAGFNIDPKPIKDHRWTLAAVRTWFDWANLEKTFYHVTDSLFHASPGDLVLFDHLLEKCELDHIGIVTQVNKNDLVCAEGAVNNRSGNFLRPINEHVRGFIRLK